MTHGQSEAALIHLRRLFFLKGATLSLLMTFAGILVAIAFNGKVVGCIATLFFGLCTLHWLAASFLSDDALLDLPGNTIEFFASNEPVGQGTSPEPRVSSKVSLFSTLSSSEYGVWDRELDGSYNG